MRVLWLLVCCIAALVLTAGCATTKEQEKSPEQLKLEARYEALRNTYYELQRERSQLYSRTQQLFNKVSRLETNRRLGSKHSLAVTTNKAPSRQNSTLGPLRFKRKSATFRIRATGPGTPGAFSVHRVQISR